MDFNAEPNIVNPNEPHNLKPRGQTNMADAVETALTMVDRRHHFYLSTGTQSYKPWIVLLSDGVLTDTIDEVAQKVMEKEEQGKLKFFSLGVAGSDWGTLHKLSGKKVFFLEGYKYTEFFGDWLNKSMRAISRSTPGQKEDVSLPGLPQNVYIHKDVSVLDD